MNNSATFLVDDADVVALRNILSHLVHIGYCETKVRDRLGLADLSDLRWRALPVYHAERLAERDPLASAIDLFLLQGTLPVDEINRLFSMADQDVLVRAGLLFIDEEGHALARASLFPVGDHLVFSDHAWPRLPHPGCIHVPYDQVMFVGTDSRWLARATIRRHVGATLDLCTGSGVQALLAAFHSQRVLAVDINPRAARCTRLNSQASAATNIEVRVGDLYQPIGGERFDLITANPPFVPSPVNSLQFRDGGHSGEEVQRRIIAGLPHHLAPGGTAQIVTEFGERDDEPLSDRLREWLGGAPMDILILRLRTTPAATYAIGHANSDDTHKTYFDSVHAWAGNLKAQGYTRVVSVLLAFQWSDPTLGPSWTRSEESPPPPRDAGIEVEGLFFAERLAHSPNLYETLGRSQVWRTGPIGLMQVQVLGSDLSTNTQAKTLGKALSITQWLDPIEREILQRIDKPLALPELLSLTSPGLDKETVFAAVGSLLRRGLVLLTPINDSC
ncbi:MAG: methyltransferase [Negativicutes bacterium]|nr:methyltransferase [Negativicutes bacterium]